MKRYWLMKAEEETYPITLFQKEKTTFWDGVRNYTARNFLRDQVQKGDLFLFYHSQGKPSGVAGIGKILRAGYPDHTAFDPKDIHYDPKSDPKNPAWYMVDVGFVKAAKRVIPLDVLKLIHSLKGMKLFKMSRLSVQPVTESEWKTIIGLKDYW